jgi:hypothetical protein
MKANRLIRVVSLLILPSVALTAQVARQAEVPLRNWVAPLYWQSNQVEREAAGAGLRQGLQSGAAPQLQFSANAVSMNALTFVAITPCRLVDTRGGVFNGITPFSGPSIAAAASITIPVQSAAEAIANTTPAPCGVIPSIAQAYSLNLTVVPHAAGAVSYVSLWPAGGPQPFVSTLNDPQGAIVSNAAIVPAGTPTGGISVFNAGPAVADVIIDMNGYFAAPTDLNGNTAIGAGTLLLNTTGTGNTASGYGALQLNTSGSNNTANGSGALVNNNAGTNNTASGFEALTDNTTGNNNTASGYFALFNNTTGGGNTAGGANALYSNTIGANNTASGFSALYSNTTGSGNVASGNQVLRNNNGNGNTASGNSAMLINTTGSQNTASGANSLGLNTTGNFNVASGSFALASNTTGSNNTASGNGALESSTTGSNNIAIGNLAASAVSGANGNNIHIGSVGASGDSAAIRIGTQGSQTSTFIAGISGATPGSPNSIVCIDANGQLGTGGCTLSPSSQRFKDQIADMGDSSSSLLQLRPVTFFYKPQYDDGSHALQYGLIAEEVVKLYPELVGYDKDGQPSSVKYQELAPMLLNEMQKQNAQLQNEVQQRQEENRKLEERLAALEALLSSQTPTAARSAGIQ